MGKTSFNGDEEYPTFKPSLKITLKDGYVCHSSVTRGSILFKSDSTHELRGQCIELKIINGG